MIAALALRPDAAYYLVGFIVFGVLACATRLGWLMYEWEKKNMVDADKDEL